MLIRELPRLVNLRSVAILLVWLTALPVTVAEDVLVIDNGVVRVGIDRDKGAAITWLSTASYPKNMVNLADPGRLIQQSYYAGSSLDRRSDGQSDAWSPWPWNPIQGGGVGSWAHASKFERDADTLFSETTPQLWDMPNEEAKSVMRQWTTFEPSLPNTIVVRCEFVSLRDKNDRWGPAVMRHQEVPACYFTRNFVHVRSYLGNGKWREESHTPGPPWQQAEPPQKAMALFDASGQGVALFCPASTQRWNFGSHGEGLSDDPEAGPCMHVASIDLVKLGPESTYSYRYWMVLGDEQSIAESLDVLGKAYSQERAELTQP
ncbi:hypothetical protein [Allorhodopirellula solitaria]|uniref:hypothetical protein n=1 Tax=Allorhodopirellula solitaria TaxID=2527987 RepID=UPI001FE5E5C7|nr:hypothetical protein [Allorhodopirellula solitaria]